MGCPYDSQDEMLYSVSWWKKSSLSRLGQVQHPRQQASKIAAPTATRTAKAFPSNSSHSIRLRIVIHQKEDTPKIMPQDGLYDTQV
jgi:hypothetical protein